MFMPIAMTRKINSPDGPSSAHMATTVGARGILSGGQVLEAKAHRCHRGSYLDSFPMTVTSVCLSSSYAGNMCLSCLSFQNIIPEEGMRSFINDHQLLLMQMTCYVGHLGSKSEQNVTRDLFVY